MDKTSCSNDKIAGFKPPVTHLKHYKPPADTGLDIVHIDPFLIALNKPGGLLTVPGRGEDRQDCLLHRVQQQYAEALVVHRLDMATSGLVLLARDKNSQRTMSKLFEQRRIDKTYIAVVEGRLENSEGQIDLPLICDWPNRPRQMVDQQRGKAAVTRYHLLEYLPEYDLSRVELRPVTGRSHQLRVHMQALGHPVLGDELYGQPASAYPCARLMLHSSRLEFDHPMENRRLQLNSDPEF